MEIALHHKMWAEALVNVLAAAEDEHAWYDRVTDDLYCIYMCKDLPLVNLFADLFYFCDSMVFTALGQGSNEAIATMDLMNLLIHHASQRMVTHYAYSVVEVHDVSRRAQQDA